VGRVVGGARPLNPGTSIAEPGFGGLLKSLSSAFVADPLFTPSIIKHVGVPALVNWIGHVTMMGIFTGLDIAVALVREKLDGMAERDKFVWRRRMESWKYGSGMDFDFDAEESLK